MGAMVDDQASPARAPPLPPLLRTLVRSLVELRSLPTVVARQHQTIREDVHQLGNTTEEGPQLREVADGTQAGRRLTVDQELPPPQVRFRSF